MSAMQALKGGHTIQRRGLDTHLSDYASKEKVCTVCMVQIADCKALLRVSVLAVSWLTFTLRTHMHSVQAYGSAANNRFCLRLALLRPK